MITELQIMEYARQAHREPVHPNHMFPPSLYYRFMRVLARETKPSISVVLGVCGGGDCLHLLDGYPHDVYGIDIAYDHPVNILTIRNMYPDKFHFVHGDSLESLKLFKERTIDILFIDTVHTYSATMAEFNGWLPHMKPEGVVLLDDLFRDGMQQAWDEIPARAKIRMDGLHIGGNFDDGGFGAVLL